VNSPPLDQIESAISEGNLPQALRLCVQFGGGLGSADLQKWALKELQGYDGNEKLPQFRRVRATIAINGVIGNRLIKGQHLMHDQLPDEPRGMSWDYAPVGQGVDELQAYVDSMTEHHIAELILPDCPEVRTWLGKNREDPSQTVTQVYWAVGKATLVGVLASIEITLIALIAEVRSRIGSDTSIPGPGVVDESFNLVVEGHGNRVTVQQAGRDVTTKPASDGGFWTRTRKAIAGSFAIVSFVSAIVTIGLWQGWIT
jgi:hypothetical protein